MRIPEAIDQAAKHLSELSGGKPLTHDAIVEETLKVGSQHGEHWSPNSVMPYDFCHNHENAGSRPQKYRIFNKVGPKLYEYVGPMN